MDLSSNALETDARAYGLNGLPTIDATDETTVIESESQHVLTANNDKCVFASFIFHDVDSWAFTPKLLECSNIAIAGLVKVEEFSWKCLLSRFDHARWHC